MELNLKAAEIFINAKTEDESSENVRDEIKDVHNCKQEVIGLSDFERIVGNVSLIREKKARE